MVAERLPGGLAARKMNPTGEYRTRLSMEEASVLTELTGVLVEVLGDMGHGDGS